MRGHESNDPIGALDASLNGVLPFAGKTDAITVLSLIHPDGMPLTLQVNAEPPG